MQTVPLLNDEQRMLLFQSIDSALTIFINILFNEKFTAEEKLAFQAKFKDPL